jgi:hypothetical protein
MAILHGYVLGFDSNHCAFVILTFAHASFLVIYKRCHSRVRDVIAMTIHLFLKQTDNHADETRKLMESNYPVLRNVNR